MKWYKTLFICVLTLLINICSCFNVNAESIYLVANSTSDGLIEIENFTSLNAANAFYLENIDNYDNLVLLEDNKVLKMEYGVVNFTNDDVTHNTEYESDTNGYAYINNTYAVDAAYLKTNDNFKNVHFILAGDKGTVSFDEVELIPYEQLNSRLSMYEVENNILKHNVKVNLNNNYYAFSYPIDNAPNYLENGKSYFSYDGHYFYKDFKKMIDDYRNNVTDNSINTDNPYFNYYEYLPHRSYTNYSEEEVEDYFTNTLYLDGKIQFYDDLNLDNANDDVNLSQYYDELEAFFGYEKLYGANAMMMLALSTHETAYGKSYLAFTRNNLFGHAAFDSDVERYASRYKDIATSVYSHAKYYISRSYAGVHSSIYYGSFFGDKLSGMNVAYSSDPYWGEKAASYYYRFDADLGFKDLNSYALGIITGGKKINFYKNEDLTSLSFSLNYIDDYSLILLEELDNAYKVQVDASYSDEYLYDPEYSVAYISKDHVKYIINADKITNKTYKTVTFDYDGGQVIDKNNITVKVLSNAESISPIPYKEGYEFIGYDKKLNSSDLEYKAQYKKIEKIEVVEDFQNVIEYDYFFNIKHGKIEVTYDDGTTKVLDIDSNMIENYDSTIEGETNIVINYCGVKTEYPVTFSKELKEYRNNLDEKIANNIESYKNDGTYNLQDLEYIKENLKKVDYVTHFDTIRYIDKMLLETKRDEVNYNFKDSKYDVSISGLALALNDPKELDIFKPFKDTYYVEVKKISNDSYKRLKEVAEAYGFTVEDSLKISVNYNLETASFANPIIMEVKLQDKKQDKIYSVYHLDADNNVIKCLTTQSNNYIQFMTRSEGDFMILSMDSVNEYDIPDAYENISIYNSDADNHLLFIEGAILVTITLLSFIMIVIYKVLNRKEEDVWNDYKKSLLEAELLQEEKPKN